MSFKVVFMGTPEFAVESLKALLENNIEVAAVVTSPDRPAGRGQKIAMSAVKEFAQSKDLEVLQPTKLKDEDFVKRLKEINADLFVVVAFRMLPEIVWSMPAKGTINLHGSLLPRYRGAAPINWAVMNGDKVTGATTFFIEKEIDTGQLIDQVKISIHADQTAGELHDEMMVKGAHLLVDTVQSIKNGTAKGIKQNTSGIAEKQLHAPKIFKPDCQINWELPAIDIHNKIRGLSPYPTAWTIIEQNDTRKTIKLFKSSLLPTSNLRAGEICVVDESLRIGTDTYDLRIDQLQLEGKKKMSTVDFLKGFNIMDWGLLSTEK
jgi:methionyl-tRNA formyltransferase